MSEQEAFELGARIQEARRSAGLELCAIAEEICVSKSYLVAIEEGRFDDLPALPFAIGFIRAFATEIGLDSDEVAVEFKAIVKPVVQEEKMPEHEASREHTADNVVNVKRGPLYGGLAVVLSAMSAAWMVFVGGGQPVAYVKSTPANESVQMVDAKTEDIQVASISQQEMPVINAATEAESEDIFAPANNELLGVANAKDEGENDLNLQATEVMFEARQDAWLRIANDDTVLFEGVLRAGDHYVPPMGPALSLTTSNAGGLAMHIGEHDLGVLGSKGGIIKNVKIDPDSLILRLVETL